MSKKRRMIFIILGLAFLSVPSLRQAKDTRLAEEYIEEMGVSVDEEETDNGTLEQESEAGTGKKEDSKEIPEGAIGIIEIESLDLRYPIFEGAGTIQLNEGIGHLSETAGLLEKGNCVLAGHNGSRRGIFFTNLSSIRIGAKVAVTNKKHEKHIYEVVDTGIVGPYDASVRAESEEECLTLFTCAYHGTQRFVCRCWLLKKNHNSGDAENGKKISPD